jgi:hypothetical protein|eukprot:evm.model.NODE_9836_length_17259_cov_22.632713.3
MLQVDKGTAGLVVPSIYKLYVNLTGAYVQHITPASGPQHPEQRQMVSSDVLHAGVRQIRAAMAADMKQCFPWMKLRNLAVASVLAPRTQVSDGGKENTYDLISNALHSRAKPGLKEGTGGLV